MKIAVIIFMVLVVLIALLSVGLVLRDVIEDIKSRRAKAAERASPEASAKADTTVREVANDVVTAESAATTVDDAPEHVPASVVVPVENGVTFALSTARTLKERYQALPDEEKGYYDGICAHAAIKPHVKCRRSEQYEEYKIGNTKLVKLYIRRGTVVCELLIPNSDFQNYITENKVKVKQRPTALKVVDSVTLKTAKDGIDLVERLTEEEAEQKRQLVRARRKAKRDAAALAQDNETSDQTFVIE